MREESEVRIFLNDINKTDTSIGYASTEKDDLYIYGALLLSHYNSYVRFLFEVYNEEMRTEAVDTLRKLAKAFDTLYDFISLEDKSREPPIDSFGEIIVNSSVERLIYSFWANEENAGFLITNSLGNSAHFPFDFGTGDFMTEYKSILSNMRMLIEFLLEFFENVEL